MFEDGRSLAIVCAIFVKWSLNDYAISLGEVIFCSPNLSSDIFCDFEDLREFSSLINCQVLRGFDVLLSRLEVK